MKGCAVLGLAALLVGAAGTAWSQPAGQDTTGAAPDRLPLAVCLQSNDPPLSVRGGDAPSGFDVALSGVVAQRLDRRLRVQWFVSRDDPDADLRKDANALLSDGRCQLVAEYPLVVSTLAPPFSPRGRLPPFEGATPDDRRRWVTLGLLAATRPYRSDVLTVVLAARKGDRGVSRLADLDGLTIGVQLATMADAIAMQYEEGRLVEHVVHVPDARALFEGLQSGRLDAAFVDQRVFDAWRIRHGAGGLSASGYRHSVGFNMGYVGLAADMELIKAVDAVLGDLEAHDLIAPIAAEAGLTLVPPRTPAVSPDVGRAQLAGD